MAMTSLRKIKVGLATIDKGHRILEEGLLELVEFGKFNEKEYDRIDKQMMNDYVKLYHKLRNYRLVR